MAVVRARSSPPYALIIFIFLTVVLTGIVVWMASQQGAKDEAVKQANLELARLEGPRDRPAVDLFLKDSKGPGSPSALRMALDQIESLKGVIEPAGTKSADAVVSEAKQVMKDTGAITNLVDRLKDAVAQVKQEKDAADALRAQFAKLQDESRQASEASKAAIAAAQKSVDELKAQVASSTAAQGDERKKLEEMEAAAQQKLTAATDAAEKETRRLGLLLDQAKLDIVDRDHQIAELKLRIQRDTAPTVAMAPAGVIIRCQPGSGECYINLGRPDRVVVGLTFSVHDPKLGIRGSVDTLSAKTDDVAAAAGKGGIEVIEVGENESLCRITQTTKGQLMQPGDLLSNPVYQNNKNRKNHFVVFGDFDLDGDGVATAAEHDRIVHMISDWGGVIDDKLTSQTDYLVLGAPPAAPTLKTDDTPGGAVDQQKAMAKAYDDLEVEAKRSSVPILNANRFLAMVGYYNTTIAK